MKSKFKSTKVNSSNNLCPNCRENIKTSDIIQKTAPGEFFRCPRCKTLLIYFDTGRGIDVWEAGINGILDA